MTVQERLKKEIKSLNEQQLHDLEQYIANQISPRFTIITVFLPWLNQLYNHPHLLQQALYLLLKIFYKV